MGSEPDDDLEARVERLEEQVSKTMPSRRQLLAGAGTLGVGALLGGGAGSAAAADGTTDESVGAVGAQGSSVDVYLDQLLDESGDEVLNVDDSGTANATGRGWEFDSVNTEEQSNTIVCSTDDDPQAKLDEANTEGKDLYLTSGRHSVDSSITVGSDYDEMSIRCAGPSTEIEATGDFPVFDINQPTHFSILGYPIIIGGGKGNTSAHGIDAERVTYGRYEIENFRKCRDCITVKEAWQVGLDFNVEDGDYGGGNAGNYRGLVTREPDSASDNTALRIFDAHINDCESWGMYCPHISGTKADSIEVGDCGEGIQIGGTSTGKVQFLHVDKLLVDTITDAGSTSFKLVEATGGTGNDMRIGHLWVSNCDQGPELVDMEYINVGNVLIRKIQKHGLTLDNVKNSMFSDITIRDASLESAGTYDAVRLAGTDGPPTHNYLAVRAVGGNHNLSVNETAGNDNWIVALAHGQAGVSRNSNRTVVNGWALNNGNPTVGGDWNGNGYEGVTVLDYANGTPYAYVNDGWVAI